MIDIMFTPEKEIPDQEEEAKQFITNLLDKPEWNWLTNQIREEKLPWSKIYDIVQSKL